MINDPVSRCGVGPSGRPKSVFVSTKEEFHGTVS
jgi:hypothetical protein